MTENSIQVERVKYFKTQKRRTEELLLAVHDQYLCTFKNKNLLKTRCCCFIRNHNKLGHMIYSSNMLLLSMLMIIVFSHEDREILRRDFYK